MPGTVPIPTPILHFTHVDNLAVCLQVGGLYAPNMVPVGSDSWQATHNVELQKKRGGKKVPCGPKGTLHDYVPFYFGPHSPMLLKLKTGEVPGYNEGQEPLVYLVSNAQAVAEADLGFVFTDGHAYAAFSSWFDNLKMLAQVDWIAVASRYWGAQNDPSGELQRRKQAEFLVHGFLDWALIHEVAVIDNAHKEQVEEVLEEYGSETSVAVRREWYY